MSHNIHINTIGHFRDVLPNASQYYNWYKTPANLKLNTITTKHKTKTSKK